MWVSAFTVDDLTRVLLIGTLVLLLAVAAVRLSTRSGLPSLLLYLGIGLLIGESGFGIEFGDAGLTHVLGYAALVLILTEGGLTTKWRTVRPSVLAALSLSTVGVMVSIAVVAVAGRLFFDWSWTTALLVGAVLASTDAAAVFSVLRSVPLRPRLRGMLEAESGLNDAPVVLLVIAISERTVSASPADPWWVVAAVVVAELAGGAVVGLGIGWLGVRLMRWSVTASGLLSIGVVAVAVLAYAVAASLHASGFLATYVCALVLGNARLPHRAAVLGFAAGVGWLAQIGLFVMLGLLASPSRLPPQVVPALVIGLVLLLVARPLSVVVSLAPFGLRWREQAFLSWAGLRGAVPIVLATVPITLGSIDGVMVFDLVLVLVIAFTVVQAPTLPRVASALGVTEAIHSQDLELEVVALEEVGAEVLQVTIGKGSRLAGVDVVELRLPTDTKVALLVRGETRLVPRGMTRLRVADRLLIVTSSGSRAAVEARLSAVSEKGRLAGWI